LSADYTSDVLNVIDRNTDTPGRVGVLVV